MPWTCHVIRSCKGRGVVKIKNLNQFFGLIWENLIHSVIEFLKLQHDAGRAHSSLFGNSIRNRRAFLALKVWENLEDYLRLKLTNSRRQSLDDLQFYTLYIDLDGTDGFDP